MAQYRLGKRISFSSSEESRFRSLFNAWAASVPGFNRNKLGDQLKIVEVWDAPLYQAVLRTQYDTRLLHEESERAKGRKFPAPTITKESDINRWTLVPYPSSFTSTEGSLTVKGSERIVNCHTCGAQGEMTCPTCGGQGKSDRKVDIKVECSSCYGKGYKTNPSKEIVTKHVLNYSSGQWETKYETVTHENRTECYHCKGKGYIDSFKWVVDTCEKCGGRGKLVCSTCAGDKQLMTYWEMRRTQYNKSLSACYFPPEVSQDEVQKLMKLFDKTTPWTLVERVRIEREEFQKAALAERPVVGPMLSFLQSRVEHPQNTAICFSEVEVSECQSLSVIYEVDGERFVCLLVGPQWKLFTVTSPVSKKMDSLKEKVNTYCRQRKYGKAWAYLQKVNKFPQAGSNEAYMQERLEERMAGTTRLSSNLVLMLCVLLVAPALYLFYSNTEFYAIWTKWLMTKWDITPTAFTLMSILIMLVGGIVANKSLPAFSYRAASGVSRSVRGGMVGLGTFVMMGLLSVILTYLGGTALLYKVFKIALSIVMFFVIIIVGLIQRIF